MTPEHHRQDVTHRQPVAGAPRHSAADIATALGLPTPTSEQRAVIEAPLRSMLVVAGAGSGKTETMSGRVVWLVANGLVAPERILGLTFTRKAAGELAERIGGRLRRLAGTGLWTAPTTGGGPGTSSGMSGTSGTSGTTGVPGPQRDGPPLPALEPDMLPTVATYHSYAGALVREHGLRLGIEPDARLLTEAAAWQYAHEVVVRYDGAMDRVDNAESTVTAAVRDLAGQLAEHLCTRRDLEAYLTQVEERVCALPAGSTRSSGLPGPVKELVSHVRAQRQLLPLLDAYARTKTAAEALDFSDQMAMAATLADLDPTVARAERARWSVVLLDEFQDTSEAQMRLLHSVFADPTSGPTRPVTAVGDPHQSIYGWRGASATTLAAFPRRFAVPAGSTVVDDLPDETAEGPAHDDPARVDPRPGAVAVAPGTDDPIPQDRARRTHAEMPAAEAPAAEAPAAQPPVADPGGRGGSSQPAPGHDDTGTHTDTDTKTPTGSGTDMDTLTGTDARAARSPGRIHGRQTETPPVLPLSTSWRNHVAILGVANAVAAPLSAHSPVPVRELRPSPVAGPGRVEAARLATVVDEAEFVADRIAEEWWHPGSHRHTGVTAAVLCRRRAQFAAMAEALGARGIPVEVVGLGGLLTRPEVSDIVCLLRVVHDPSRGDALMRLLTGPHVRLGAADLDALGAWSRALRREETEEDARRRGATGDPVVPGGDGTGSRLGAPETRMPPAPSPAEPPTDPSTVDAGTLPADGSEEPSLVEALDALPPPDWTGSQGETLSATARRRLDRLAETIATVRALVGHPLPDLVVAAERALGLDVEVAAAVDALPETARRHLDAFADAAAGFAYGADRPTLGGFLDWLDAARDEERGLDSPAAQVAEGAVQVLTVHAAKGLEWDVVAVPGLVEASFPSHRSYWPPKGGGLPTPTSKGWLTGLGSIPYDLRGDAEGLPSLPWQTAEDLGDLVQAVKEFSAAGGDHMLEEERRLAYVAFTRARRRLLLTATVWLDGERPRVPSRFLTEVLDGTVPVTVTTWAPDPAPEDANPALADVASARWPVTRDDARDHAEALAAGWVLAAGDHAGRHDEVEPYDGASSGPDRAPEEHTDARDEDAQAVDDAAELDQLARIVDVLLAERQAPSAQEIVAQVPGHLSTSALVDLRTDPRAYVERLRRPMPAPPASAARLGTEFHAWIERHYRRAGLVDDVDLTGWADEDDAVTPDLETAKALFLACPWADMTPLEVEVPLETVIGGMPVRGRIDAVFPGPGDGVTVVDWKTGAPPPPARLAERSVQLAVYRLAYARWRGLDPDLVEAAFYYAATGETIRPDLPGEDDLVTLLQDLDGIS